MAIVMNIDVMLAKRKMSVTELSEKIWHNNDQSVYFEKWEG